MATCFNWFRPGYEVIKLKFDWNVEVPFLKTTDGGGEEIKSPFFSSQENPDRKWKLRLFDDGTTISICMWHFNSAGESATIVEPVLAKISILKEKDQKLFQFTSPSLPGSSCAQFNLSKEKIIESKCQLTDGSLTFHCKILFHVKKEPVTSADHTLLAMDCSGGLVTHLEGLFDGMPFSDVIFNVGGREFPAHKSILAVRSEVFAAMFQHPTKENLTNQIEIEDTEPEVFQELLRFIYTGRVPKDKMETMAAGLLIAADKYLVIELRNECENFLVHHMSPANCVELLIHGDLLNPVDHLEKVMKGAGNFFRRLQSEVMATKTWEKMEEVNPKKLFEIQKILFSNK